MKIDAIIVGSLVSWDPKNNGSLLRLGSEKYITLMKKLIVSETIRSSKDIFYGHVWGFPQVDYRDRTVCGQRRPAYPQRNPQISSNNIPQIEPLNGDSEVTEHSQTPGTEFNLTSPPCPVATKKHNSATTVT